MRKAGKSLKQQVAIVFLSLVSLTQGCTDRFDSAYTPAGKDKEIEVWLDIAWAASGQESAPHAADVSAYRSKPCARGEAFEVNTVIRGSLSALAPSTKAAVVYPDRLYNLEIRQYDRTTGACLNPSATVLSQQEVGDRFSVPLAESSDCRLVCVAWGTSVSTRLGTDTYAKAQEKAVAQAEVKDLDPLLVSDMNKMPYYLCLDHVRITSEGKIQNPDGTDVRIRLQRLASRLSFAWDYGYAGYQLHQIRLESVPTHYKVIPDPDNEGCYPSLFDQYSVLSIPESAIDSEGPGKGSYACWIPASVRGSRSEATSPLYRTKKNAPTGSVYATFLAENTADAKKKLNYRVYLGGNTTSDFNLYANAEYRYSLSFRHTELPVNDGRVSIIDPVPASVNNENFVPTANCFMVSPGGAFCFNPYTYYQNGQVIANSLLQSWCATDKIRSVKVVWQTKESGDVGDPVLGVVNFSSPQTPADDHTNIVDLKNGDQFDEARIYCRVAPNTTGGSGLIAAYSGADGTGTLLWSWHIWVTDYNPDPTGNTTVLTPVTKRKQKYTYNLSDQYPMMDRNLGAIAGFTLADPPKDVLDMSKANGLDYQWGRKDPFTGSYSAVPVSIIKGLTSTTTPPKGMLNRFGTDGITYLPLLNSASKTTIQNAYRHPTTFYILNNSAIDWCSESSAIPTLWNDPNTDAGVKTVHDPCPAGWRVISYKHLYALFESTPVMGTNGNPNAANPDSGGTDGGFFLYYAAKGSGEASYYRMTGYHRYMDEYHSVGEKGNLWLREHAGTPGKPSYGFVFSIVSKTQQIESFAITSGWYPQDTHTVRCIQERE